MLENAIESAIKILIHVTAEITSRGISCQTYRLVLGI